MARQEISGLNRVGVIAVLTALAALGTMMIRIPIPATTGYFNIGDVFVMLAGLWLGPVAGMTVGLLGPTLADAIGFPQFILATAVTKGIEGFLVGAIGGRNNAATIRKVTAVAVGALTIVIGYFVFEAYVYPALAKTIPLFAVTDLNAALVELLPNTIQGIIAAAASVGLWRAIAGRQPPASNTEIKP